MLVESIPDAVLVVESDGTISQANEATERLLGWAPEALRGKPLDTLIPPRFHNRHGGHVDTYRGAPRPRHIVAERHIVAQHRDGSEVEVEVGLTPLTVDGRSFVLSIVRDVSERARVEAHLRQIVESAPTGLLVTSGDGSILMANHEVATLFGRTPDEMIGEPVGMLVPHTLRPAHEANVERYAQLGTRGPMGARRPVRGLHADGTEVPLEVTLNRFAFEGRTYVIATVKDITLRQLAEASKVEYQQALEQSNVELQERNLQLQQFAYAAAHDLREPLRSMASFSQLLTRGLEDRLDDREQEWLDTIVNGAERMERLLTELLAFSELDTDEVIHEQVELEQALGAALAHLQPQIAETDAEVTWDALPAVAGDGERLSQLFVHLISNALRFKNEHAPRIHLAAQREGDAWRLGLRDNGVGIPPDQHENVFRLFKRLHHQSEIPGVGTGLALARLIVQRHRGSIHIESALGRGTTVVFTLPASDVESARE